MRSLLNILTISTCATLPAIAGGLPITGRPIASLAWMDTEMVQFMARNGISGGLLAVMRDGCVIYQRGFGWHDDGESEPMPENALVRIASCTKPFTAAAIQRLADEGVFGPQGIDRNAFNLGQPGGGVLNISPFPTLGDSRLRDVTIRDLLTHRGGWDRGEVGDLTYRECSSSDDMDIASPPGRTNTLRWILGQELQFTPGSDSAYSNIGSLAMGLIVEQVSGQSLVAYLRSNILTADMWVPSTDLRQGRTFRSDQPVREAYYDAAQDFCVFETSDCPQLIACSVLTDTPYGSWDHEARVGQGGLVVSPATILQFADRFLTAAGADNIGQPMEPGWTGSHGGALAGVNCRIVQRADGLRVFVWFNKQNGDEETGNFASQMYDRLKPTLDGQTNWPTLCIDGFWVEPNEFLFPETFGSYDEPFHTLGNALDFVSDGSKLNLEPGNSAWTGLVNKKVLLRAPLGTARIGA